MVPGVDRRRGRALSRNIDSIVRDVALLALDKKGEDVVILDLREVSEATDFFVMVSGDTDVQVRAIADHVVDRLREREKIKPWHVEGRRYGNWILLDYVDFVVHVFEKGTREYYQLERLWGDAKVVNVSPENGSTGETRPS
jgi:ribosome-associated protein